MSTHAELIIKIVAPDHDEGISFGEINATKDGCSDCLISTIIELMHNKHEIGNLLVTATLAFFIQRAGGGKNGESKIMFTEKDLDPRIFEALGKFAVKQKRDN